jgi:hypothetical protein
VDAVHDIRPAGDIVAEFEAALRLVSEEA